MTVQAGYFEFARDPDGLAHRLGLPLSLLVRLAVLAQSGDAYEERPVYIRGKRRVLLIPAAPLMEAQRRVLQLLGPVLRDLPAACHAYRPGHSAVTNARTHAGGAWIQQLDVRDFFDELRASLVEDAFKRLDFDDATARLLTCLSTFDDRLPTGSPTSPALSNLILRDFDLRVELEARSRGIAYSRYADDLTFSGIEPFDMSGLIQEELSLLGLELNASKSKLRKRGATIRVTGLAVAEPSGPTLTKQFKRRLRSDLHYVQRFGLDEHALSDPNYDEENISEQAWVNYTQKRILGQLRYSYSVQPAWVAKQRLRYPKAFQAVGFLRRVRTEQRIAAIQELSRAIRARSEARPGWFSLPG